MNQFTYIVYALLIVTVATLVTHGMGNSQRWGSSGTYYHSYDPYSSGGYGFGSGGGWTGGSFHK